MNQLQYHAPDAAAMERLLGKHRDDATGVIVLLAWRAGLSRKEIGELTWGQVDLDAALLRLPDREVPVEAELRDCLRRWRGRCAQFSAYVAVSPHRRRRLAKESLSLMARSALDEEGQKDVRLQDLRYDYIQRQLQEHDRSYVLRVAGLAASACRGGLHGLKAGGEASSPREDPGEDFKFWQVLQAERGTPVGIALWLTSRMGLHVAEMVALTWDQLDFAAKTARLPGRDAVKLPDSVARVLEEERARRGPDDDPHVLLSPRLRKPVTAVWLTTLARSALIRGGIEDRTLRDFRGNPACEEEKRRLMAYVAERGSVSRKEAAALLGLSDGQAYRRLTGLVGSGRLTYVNGKYYRPGTVIPPEQRPEAICRYLEENGPAYLQAIADHLQVGKRTAARTLKSLTESGRLTLMRDQRYSLPQDTSL